MKSILDEMCNKEKDSIKTLPQEQLGSWHGAIVTSDGVWHTPGHLAKMTRLSSKIT